MLTKFETYYSKGEFGSIELTLDRIAEALKHIDFDEKKLGKIIHIAGTNGKGSTAYFIHQAALKNGYKSVLYTSPHIERINERIVLNNMPVNIELFDNCFENLKPVIEKFHLTFFEGLTLTAFQIFQKFSPDISVIETGLGGTFDATNVLNNKIPVITTISQDHSNYLGKSIYKIVDEKMNIIKNNKNVYIGKNQKFIIDYIREKHSEKNLFFIYDTDISNNLPAPYNYNLELAGTVAKNELGIKINPHEKYELPPCRMEKIGRFILDGAHNPNGIINILKNINQIDTAIISSTKDRNISKSIHILSQKIKKIIVCEIPDNERSIDIDTLLLENVIKIKDPINAVYKSLELSDKNDILICGSLYLCGFLRKKIRDNFV